MRPSTGDDVPDNKTFQSTHSLRSATPEDIIPALADLVSIHALLAECDSPPPEKLKQSWKFQSTHSLRSATIAESALPESIRVSIHALLAECDSFSFSVFPAPHCFNPRTPCGVRQPPRNINENNRKFQSTHSLRSATSGRSTWSPLKTVSIHALLAECDLGMTRKRVPMICFNPRTPCGVRPKPRLCIICIMRFNPRTPCGVRRGGLVAIRMGLIVSIHALLAECDRAGGP